MCGIFTQMEFWGIQVNEEYLQCVNEFFFSITKIVIEKGPIQSNGQKYTQYRTEANDDWTIWIKWLFTRSSIGYQSLINHRNQHNDCFMVNLKNDHLSQKIHNYTGPHLKINNQITCISLWYNTKTWNTGIRSNKITKFWNKIIMQTQNAKKYSKYYWILILLILW